jgi:outer membrane protein
MRLQEQTFQMKWRRALSLTLCALCPASTGWAQQQSLAPQRPTAPVIIRPYLAPTVPGVRLSNSGRLRDLVRAGKLYLTVQDAIAIAIENNIDVESARYNPLITEWNYERAQAGGALPGVPSSASQAGSVQSGQGVSGSQAAAGVSITGNSQGGSGTGNASISQIGPVTPNLDPAFQDTQTYSHRSSPQPNSVLSAVPNLIQNTRNSTIGLNQGVISGGTITLTYRDSYLNENAPTDVLNPSTGVSTQLSVQHNLLQGFGVGVNSRTIRVARANLAAADLTFKGQVIGVVANVLNLYYGLVADYEDVKAKETAVQVAQQFYENNKKQVQIGTLAPLDVTTAEAQVASSQQDLVTSRTALEQQQLQLKNALSRNGLFDPTLANVQVIPLDHIEVPEQDNLPPPKEMIASALQNRTNIATEKINLQNAQISALGTANGVLPQLTVFGNITTQGLAGTPRIVPLRTGAQAQAGEGPIPSSIQPCPPGVGVPGGLCQFPDPYFVGGLGNSLGQMVRRNFPTQRIGAYTIAKLRNNTAQADYAIDQLSLKQTELQNQKDLNQIAVDVSNQATGLQQARVRYQAAVRSRILQQQLLDAEQKKFSLGASTTFNVVQQQRDLAAAQSSEVASLVSYSNAKVALDETLGTTLIENHVELEDARRGTVGRVSSLPANLPGQ